MNRLIANAISVFVATSSAFAAAPNAYAQPVTAQRHAAEERFNAGLQHSRKQEWEDARVEFAQAYLLEPKPEALWNLALAEEKSGRPLEALDHFRTYVADTSVPAPRRDRARKHIDELSAKTGRIAIQTNASATVRVDGKPLSSVPTTPIDVLPGKHALEASVGDRTRNLDVVVAAGSVAQADLHIEETAPPAPTPIPAAAPSSISPMPPAPTSKDLMVPEPTREGARLRVPLLVTFGVGSLAAIATGIVFRVKAGSDGDQSLAGAPNAKSVCVQAPQTPGCASAYQGEQDRLTDTNLSTGFFIGGAVLATAFVGTWFLVKHDDATATKTSIAPIVAPGVAGLQLHGGF